MLSLNLLKTQRCILLTLITLFGITSCKKGGSPAPIKKSGTDVYVIGDINAANYISVATYWKNGIAKALVSDTTISSIANGITIKDTDVYICGKANNTAVYWKNGIATTLSNGVLASAITISGSDVYVAGSANINNKDAAAYWKNNTLIALDSESPNTYAAYAFGIAVNGNDVYVTGMHINNDLTTTLLYWKNGVETDLSRTLSTLGFSTGAITIALNGPDVYITGSGNGLSVDHTQATYWKNGQQNVLTNVLTSAALNAIAFNNGNAYFVGYSNGMAAYWENNTEHDFTNSLSQYMATAIAFNGSDMYIAGYSGYTTSYAVYWKNGVLVPLSTRPSITSGIGIVQY
jgi:hypothetical protein